MVKGSFKDISFIELLQLMYGARKTGRIEVTQDKKWAMVIFREGVIWHVEPRGFRGISAEEVVYEILAMQDANFILQRVEILPTLERSINLSTENILMESAKRQDEEDAVSATMGGDGKKTKQVLRIRPGSESRVRYVSSEVKVIIALVDGNRNLNEVVQQSGIDQTRAAQIVKDLIDQGILDAIDVVVEDSAKGQTVAGE